jgi:hypothetical protein
MGDLVEADQKAYQFAITLEHWFPQQDSNPILDRADASTPEEILRNVGDEGATMEDGMFTVSSRTRANIRVSLHDDGEFTFPLRSIYNLMKQREEQPSLF